MVPAGSITQCWSSSTLHRTQRFCLRLSLLTSSWNSCRIPGYQEIHLSATRLRDRVPCNSTQVVRQPPWARASRKQTWQMLLRAAVIRPRGPSSSPKELGFSSDSQASPPGPTLTGEHSAVRGKASSVPLVLVELCRFMCRGFGFVFFFFGFSVSVLTDGITSGG